MAEHDERCPSHQSTEDLTMLFLVKALDAIAGLLVTTELCLVFLGIEVRLAVPKLELLYIH